MKTRIVCFFFVICFFSVHAYSSEAIKVESLMYFNAIHSFKAEFIQTNSINNATQYGMVMMKKPGLLKWDYYPPTPASIIIQGATVSYYDKELEEYSYSIINNPIINFLSSNIQNTKDIIFVNISTFDNKKVITIQDQKTQLQADVIFNIHPTAIVGLNIANPDSITYIKFYNIQNNVTITETEFRHNTSYYN
ncbi:MULTISPECIES: LolA family protein [Ehrlichia]|uniref:Outer membrane lipocarrier LolA family protein n=1 Tax=Ehrlichia cf. muris str. EmCRT TaxID=1359167 RepID=A0A0F3N6U1_9RICK|nr:MULTISPECIES: outer membrane lipoprotein carrier protein LolA [Ehrlichia]KJV63422.1 outer membrane lipocarrier LolA family protein [Ehrlichia cf. muris str. EmCRT]OUC04537.1 membrane protein [Ehrlichia sp. Wisconsin_h]